MSAITLIDLSIPNDGNGDKLRVGGGYINTNFQNLNADKLERGGYLGTAQDLFDLIAGINTDLSNYARIDAVNAFAFNQTFNQSVLIESVLTLSRETQSVSVADADGVYEGLSTVFSDGSHNWRFANGILVERNAI